MGGTLSFSFKADNYLSIAQELEQAGFKEAATYLRQKVESLKEIWAALEAEKQTEQARRRREYNIALARDCRDIYPNIPPTIINPDIRPDQITSS